MPGKTSITNEAFFEYTDSKENIKKTLEKIDNFMKFADEMPEPIHPIRYEKLLKEIVKILESGRKASDIDKNN